MKTSLGIWALGPMVTRFVPGGYQPEHRRETMAEKVRSAVAGLGDLVDGYEFHHPGELSDDNLDEVRAALGDHGIYCIASGLHLDHRFGSGGLVSPDAATRKLRRRAHDRGGGLRRRLGAHFIIWPGIEGYNYPFQTPYADSWRWLVEGIAEAARDLRRPRGQALPRAQELRARDEDPHGQHRDGAAHHPQAARPGVRQHPGQHGLAAPDHERREPRRVRRAALAAEGLLGHQHANSGWGTFDDDNMVGATAFMETIELAVELRRADYGAERRRAARHRPLPVHRGPGRRRSSARSCSGASSTASPRGSTTRRCARPSRARTRSAPTSSSTRRWGPSRGPGTARSWRSCRVVDCAPRGPGSLGRC